MVGKLPDSPIKSPVPLTMEAFGVVEEVIVKDETVVILLDYCNQRSIFCVTYKDIVSDIYTISNHSFTKMKINKYYEKRFTVSSSSPPPEGPVTATLSRAPPEADASSKPHKITP